MNEISLSNYPNQTFNFVGDESVYDFRLHYFRDQMFVSVSVNGRKVVDSLRAISGQWLIPYKYQMTNGNFRFECDDNSDYPNYENFETTCHLRYYSKAEYEVIENG